MKYILYIIKSYLYLLFASLLMAKTTPELVDVHITLEDESYLAFKKYSLIMEFDNGEYEYIINEKFAPPGLILEFKNVKWSKGNFVKKSSYRPLYQFGVKVPKNVNLKEKKNRLELKLDL